MINKDELYEYYITENHTLEDSAKHFNVSVGWLCKVIRKYEIDKPNPFEYIKAKVNKEEILEYYLVQNHSVEETASYFKLSPSQMSRIIKELNIMKLDKSQSRKLSVTKYINSLPSEEVIYDYYIEKNYTQEETAKHLHISRTTLAYLLEMYSIKKCSQDIYSTARQTSIERYGEDYLLENKEKARNTCLEKYGVTNYNKLPEAQERRAKTCLERYGVDCTLMVPEIQAKCLKTLKDRYNVDHPSHLWQKDFASEYQEMYDDYALSLKFLKENNGKYSSYELAEKFNCNVYSIYNWIYKHQLQQYLKYANSHYEKEVVDFILSLGIENVQQRNHTVLDNHKEIDIFLPDYNLGIEFNGTYWHSSDHKPKNYHLDKSKEAESKGIRLIHIWEYEWNDPTLQEKLRLFLTIALGKVTKRIFARNCQIKEISNKEAKILNNKIHLQGHRSAQITYGLFYQGELVQLMSFSKTRYNHNLKGDNDWEIIRGCPGSNNLVVGGVSKLFTHFVRDYNPDKVFSYCDFNKFNGKSYEALGMKFIGYTGPDLLYVIKDKVFSRNPSKYKEFKESCTNKLYRCGSKKYLWSKNKHE